MLGNSARIFSRKIKSPPLQVRIADRPGVRTFANDFKIGRDESCELRIDSSHASRVHAEVCFENGSWVLRDLGSTNGTYLDDRRITECALEGESIVRIGEEGTRVTFISPAGDAKKHTASASGAEPTRRHSASSTGIGQDAVTPKRSARSKNSLESTQDFVRHYFGSDDDDASAGDRTRMIRRAYAEVEKGHRRRFVWVGSGALCVCLIAVAFVAWQQHQVDRIEDAFVDLREQDAEIARIRMVLEDRYETSLADQLERLEQERARRSARFEGFVEEYGMRRELTQEEQVIFKVARIFNESHTTMPAAFVRAVRDQIRVWQTTGRSTFITSVQRSEREGYTGMIVRAMREYDLPAEFYYLGLVESNFRHEIVGPATRYGYAKGMWQFIPETGEAYGLDAGPRVDDRAYDENDDRHDPELSTVAAARYLRDIYGTLAQASGLLAMASYNWGEHRVVSKLDDLMEGIPDDPEARSYWRFYSVYSDRMPQETKNYVIKIFAAAVVGENPRMFGFDFDNPLEPHM